MAETNRFTDMFANILKDEPKPKTKSNPRKKVDFGANLANNPALIAAVKKLHESDDENQELSSQRLQDSIPSSKTLEQPTNESSPEKGNSLSTSEDSSEHLTSLSISMENEYLNGINAPKTSLPNRTVISPGMDNVMGHGTESSQDARTHIGIPGPISGHVSGRIDDGTGHKSHPVTGPTMYPRTLPVTHASVLPPKQRINNPVWLLSRQQSKILWHLINAGGLTKREDISICTGVPFGTVKNLISSLYRDGFISKPKPYTDRAFRGFSYDLNRQLCEQFMLERGDSVFKENISDNGTYPVTHPGNRPMIYPDNNPVTHPVAGPTTNPWTHPENVLYSSSLETRSTTEDIDNLLKTDPELGYWQEKGLQPQQVRNWMEETRMSQALIIQSLKHCRFDMVENNFEESKPVQNVFNWFYSIIKKSGHYPKPTNYKSWAEKMIEIEQSLMEEQEAQNRLMEEIRTKKYKIEVERKFQEMMNNPNGETYKSVFERLSPLERELGEGAAFERSMRTRFDEMLSNA